MSTLALTTIVQAIPIETGVASVSYGQDHIGPRRSLRVGSVSDVYTVPGDHALRKRRSADAEPAPEAEAIAEAKAVPEAAPNAAPVADAEAAPMADAAPEAEAAAAALALAEADAIAIASPDPEAEAIALAEAIAEAEMRPGRMTSMKEVNLVNTGYGFNDYNTIYRYDPTTYVPYRDTSPTYATYGHRSALDNMDYPYYKGYGVYSRPRPVKEYYYLAKKSDIKSLARKEPPIPLPPPRPSAFPQQAAREEGEESTILSPHPPKQYVNTMSNDLFPLPRKEYIPTASWGPLPRKEFIAAALGEYIPLPPRKEYLPVRRDEYIPITVKEEVLPEEKQEAASIPAFPEIQHSLYGPGGFSNGPSIRLYGHGPVKGLEIRNHGHTGHNSQANPEPTPAPQAEEHRLPPLFSHYPVTSSLPAPHLVAYKPNGPSHTMPVYGNTLYYADIHDQKDDLDAITKYSIEAALRYDHGDHEHGKRSERQAVYGGRGGGGGADQFDIVARRPPPSTLYNRVRPSGYMGYRYNPRVYGYGTRRTDSEDLQYGMDFITPVFV